MIQFAGEFGVDLFQDFTGLLIRILSVALVSMSKLLGECRESGKSNSHLSQITERSLSGLSILCMLVPAKMHRLGFTKRAAPEVDSQHADAVNRGFEIPTLVDVPRSWKQKGQHSGQLGVS
jgi:hypothetical protein